MFYIVSLAMTRTMEPNGLLKSGSKVLDLATSFNQSKIEM